MNNHVAKLAGVLSLALTLAFFSPQQAAADENDPPGRVARLSYERGSVSFEPGGTDEWVAARINRPMTTGDRLWTDAGAFAEMNTGSAYIRVGANTGFSFLNLSDYATQIQLTQGTVLVRVRRLDQSETFEIDTPNLAFSIYQTGTYKVTVNEAGDVTDVQVRQGEGEVIGGGAAYSLHEGEEGRFAGTDGLEANFGSYRHHSDDFENWSSLRDRRIDHSYSSKYVSPDVIGYEDLDQYGGWRSSGEYGNVWFPHTTDVGWAPYHNGHWAYIAPWGYTWVDDEPWGFAPFHYGRWINVGGAWGWVPGPRESDYGGGGGYVRPVYAPALVAWVGGPHFAIGISVGGGGGYSQGENVGWFPLGPREVYVPSYPVSRNYVNNVNVSNTNVTNTVVNNYYNTTVVNNTNNSTNVNVTNVKYVNQTVPGAVAATTPQAFVSAQPVAKNIVQVNQREIATAPVRIAAPPVAPSKEAVLGTTAQASARPPEAAVNRTVVAKAAPPAPPVPFVQQQKAIQANGGKPLAGSEIHQMQVQEQQQVQRGQQQQQQQQQQRARSGQPAQAPQQAQQAPQPAVRIAPPAQPYNARPAQVQVDAGNRPAATPNNQQQQNNRPANQNTQQQPPQPPSQQGNRPGQPVTVSPNQPNNPNAPQQQINRPGQPQNNNVNRPNTPNTPSARPPNTPDPALELKHQQELEQLHKQQDQERQRVEQQQLQERKLQEQKAAEQLRQQQQQQAQKNADQQQQQQAQKNAAQQQQQQRNVQAQNAAEQQRQQQQQQAQKNADQQRQQQQQQAQRNADQQRQQLDQKHQQVLLQLEAKHAQEQQQLNQKHETEHQQQVRPQPAQPAPPQRQQPPPSPPQKDTGKPPKDSQPPQPTAKPPA